MEKHQVWQISLLPNSLGKHPLQGNFNLVDGGLEEKNLNSPLQAIQISFKYHNLIGIKTFRIETNPGMMKN